MFSPHFDDETLGCGGTVLKKIAAGGLVTIVFMTDGSKSHTHLISEEESRTIRSAEGRAVARALGLKLGDVILLDFEEAKLDEHFEAAVARVQEILTALKPEDVFIPYRKEPLLWSADHLATNRIVRLALKRIGRTTRVHEYPIWFWCHWPWAQLPLHSRRDIFKHMVRHSFLHGVDLLRDFRYAVPVGDLLERKRRVLEEHKSQMTRLIPDARWRTLSDVADGDFLDCFFHEHELFHVYSYPNGRWKGRTG